MPTTLRNTDILFNDNTTQSSAPKIIAGMQVFTSSGTFTVPTSVTALHVRVWGAGAGGRAGETVIGGYGGFGDGLITGLTPGATISVTVGTGGNGGSASTNPTAGGTSSFGSYISCTGGAITTNPSNDGVVGTATFSGASKISGTSGGTSFLQNLLTLAVDYGARHGNSGNVGGCNPGGGGGGGGGFSGGGGGGAGPGASTQFGTGGRAFGPGNNGSNGAASTSPSNAGAGGAGGSPGGTGGAGNNTGSAGGGGGGGGGGVVVFW